jgi:two-component system response regulator YesN
VRRVLKILIVDDETPIREWIEFCIKKNDGLYEIVGLASNGMEALEIFKSTMADIVFVDIKMPVMDGMELMKQIKLIKPVTEVIVLTAYDDFEYARSALKSGALEYVLKTEINDQMIHEILTKASQRLNSLHGNVYGNLDTIYWKRDNFLRQLLAQDGNVVEVLEKDLQEQNIRLKNSSLFAVALKYGRAGPWGGFKHDSLMPGDDTIQNILGFSYDKNIYVLLGNITGPNSLAGQLNVLYAFALELSHHYQCTIGLSNIRNGLKYIPAVVNEAIRQLDQEFYNGAGSINRTVGAPDDATLLNQLETIQNSMPDAINLNGVTAAEASFKQFFDFIKANHISNVAEVKNICRRMVDYFYSYTEIERIVGLNSMYKITEEIVKLNSFQLLQSYVWRKVNDALDGLKETQNYSRTVAKAIDFINQHYTESINLTDVASAVHLNPEYFCRLFKEETGRKFSNYLANLRLNKAVELLRNSDYKVCEIAEMVGYSNLSYFSTLFKKYNGISPFDYRNKNTRIPME